MKVFLTCIVSVLLFGANLNAQTVPSDSILKLDDYNSLQYQEWSKIYENWRQSAYYDCLKKNNIKLSCAHCESAYITVEIRVDSIGKMTAFKAIKTRICGEQSKPKVEKCFMEYFYKIEFPICFRKKRFQVQIGNGLKC